ncbi:methyltransferase (TIGR00027 family) [Nocardia sp. GAS34]|uniref:SAM-dependent methyltransferase n=1 Tax=unclassified Nocardia TaxID=2637762 RepID=UPI003D20994E
MVDKTGTAYGPIVIAAGEYRLPEGRRLVSDNLAAAMLPGTMRWIVGPAPLRRLLMSMTDREASGLWNSIACRKRYFDDRLAEATDEGIEAVVLLGAGFDTRGYRMAAPRGIPVYEVDMAVNLDAKRKRMPVPVNVVQVPIDFETDDLGTMLAARGHRPEARTLFVWEGVTQYLTEPAVRATLRFLSTAASGSRLGFTYVPRDFLDGTESYGAARAHRRFVQRRDPIWTYGLSPAEVEPLLAEYGWQLREQVDAAGHTKRYLEPLGRPGPVSDIERCVYAAKL